MKGTIGAIVHGVLLTGMLVYAYTTWTRDKSVKKTTGSVVVWNEKASALQAIVYESKDRTIRVEAKDGYYWGTDSSTKKKLKPTPPPVGDAAPAEPEYETITTTTEFPADPAAMLPLITGYSSMRAIRNLGQVSDEQKVEYEFKCGSDRFPCPKEGETGGLDSENSVTVVFAGGSRTLMLGGKALGGTDRYALDVDSGTAYIIAGLLVTPLEGGMRSLQPKQVMPTGEDVKTVTIETPDGKSKSVSRIKVADENGKQVETWGQGTEADQTTANFLTKVETSVKPTKYEATLDPKTLTALVTLTYADAKGTSLGTLTLYKKTTTPDAPPPPPEGEPAPPAPQPVTEYYVVSDLTRVPALISKTSGDQIEQNIPTVFTE